MIYMESQGAGEQSNSSAIVPVIAVPFWPPLPEKDCIEKGGSLDCVISA